VVSSTTDPCCNERDRLQGVALTALLQDALEDLVDAHRGHTRSRCLDGPAKHRRWDRGEVLEQPRSRRRSQTVTIARHVGLDPAQKARICSMGRTGTSSTRSPYWIAWTFWPGCRSSRSTDALGDDDLELG